jgi:hypothetical protein
LENARFDKTPHVLGCSSYKREHPKTWRATSAREFGLDGRDASSVKLSDLRLRTGERFSYTYDYMVFWRQQIRFERQVPAKARTFYPFCHGGARRAPKEDFGGPEHLLVFVVDWRISNRSATTARAG